MSIISPSISVIIPVYNGERYLAEAVESVLAQTYAPGEIIVVDDGSTDGTRGVAKRFGTKIRYVAQPHQNASVARNYGLQLALGTMIAFLDADDLWIEEKLERQIQAFGKQPSLDAVFCHVQNFISPDLAPEEAAQYYCPPDPMPGYSLQSILVKKELFSSLGLLDVSLEVAGAIEWCQRVLDSKRNVKLLDYIGVRRRIHTSNQTQRQRQETHKDYLRLLKRTIDRKRAGNT